MNLKDQNKKKINTKKNKNKNTSLTKNKLSEIGGPKGLEPTRYGDWEKNGRCSDFWRFWESAVNDFIKTHIIVKSASIFAKKDGVPIFISKKGDPDAGIIFIKIDTLDGKISLLRRNLNYVIEKNKSFIEYVNLFPTQEATLSEVNKRIKSEIAVDPDCWVVEIEDKNGKNYFDNI